MANDSNGMHQGVPPLLADISDTIRTNYVGFASFVILIWDHIDTFVDEVEYIWKGKRKGIFIYLFLFNRYFTPLAFILNLFAYLSPVWTLKVQENTATGCTFAIAIEVVGLMMLLRISALYPRQKWISRGLGLFLILETVMFGWLISQGEPVLHNTHSGIHACSMIFDPAINGAAASASAWIPLLYDTMIFGLTLYRTVPPIRREEASFIMRRLLEDGILYYSVIFSVTFVLTFMIVGAPPGTKNIAAQMEQLVTVAMMSRITLNLKKAGNDLRGDTNLSFPKSLLFYHGRHGRGPSSTPFMDHTIDISMSEASRLSTHQTGPNTISDDIAEHPSSRTVHHDPIHKPPPLVVARPKHFQAV